MAGQTHPDVALWERQPQESSKAYAGFLCYREAGTGRTLKGTARELGKGYALIRRWAKRHGWVERVWTWEVAQARASEAALGAEREEMLRRRLKDADRLERLAMAKLSGLVTRDPDSGELVLSQELTIADATRLYRLAIELGKHLALPAEADEARQPEEPAPAEVSLRVLSDQELQQLIALARQRASQPHREDGDEKR